MHTHKNGAVTQEFASLMGMLAEAYGQTITSSRIRIYAASLFDVPIETVKVAASQAIRECKFFPSPAELRGFVAPSREDRAMVAWVAFGQAASSVGAYASVEVEDGAAAHALEQVFGSWANFCAMEDGPALAHRRQEFLAAYRVAATEPQSPRRLTGLLPQPDPALAAHTWIARISGGHVRAERDTPQLLEGRRHAALPEARVPE